ncbi:DUF4097 family beta strand repeat-containing protein [Nocardia stercoris]|uniref:Adhesin domain-containing protein n=1 Tax=Nocardia stercoris TaxID=2483361 RepID=A0A3M2LCX3_9NOCA|nr:DUF2807 domain-containing protein [Nocardia stercoris]RMI35381.1 hypothetical protein EBN03_03675 [Nocardia stercoris]
MNAFQTPAPIAATVDILAGDITVVATDRTDTVVTVRPADPGKKADVRAAAEIEVSFTGGALVVRSPKNWRTYTPFGGNPALDVTIELPTGSGVTATSGVGRLQARGELADCAFDVAMGTVTLGRTTGTVTAKVAKGDIRIGEAVRGEVRVETSMGNLEIGIAAGSAARLETDAHGSVRNTMAPAPAATDVVHVYAHTTLGNVTVGHTVAA